MSSSKIPDLGRLSVAILEHGLEPLLGDKAIEIIRAPHEEKELRDALATCLGTTEQRFLSESGDAEVRQAIINLPLADLPLVNRALQEFYTRPNDVGLSGILRSQLHQVLPALTEDRTARAVESYVRILREELVPISKEIRDKLQTHSLLSIQRDTARIADAFDSIRSALYNPREDRVVKAATQSKASARRGQRKRLYAIDSKTDPKDIRSAWHFLGSHTGTVDVGNGILEIGSVNSETCNFPQLGPLRNCSVECEIRILDFARDDPTFWAGIRVRGFIYDFRFGYLTYMRANGSVELYRAQEILGGTDRPKVDDTREKWTIIRTDIYNSRVQVWMNGHPHVNITDNRFGASGQVFLHTFGTRAQFRNLRIFRLQ